MNRFDSFIIYFCVIIGFVLAGCSSESFYVKTNSNIIFDDYDCKRIQFDSEVTITEEDWYFVMHCPIDQAHISILPQKVRWYLDIYLFKNEGMYQRIKGDISDFVGLREAHLLAIPVDDDSENVWNYPASAEVVFEKNQLKITYVPVEAETALKAENIFDGYVEYTFAED